MEKIRTIRNAYSDLPSLLLGWAFMVSWTVLLILALLTIVGGRVIILL